MATDPYQTRKAIISSGLRNTINTNQMNNAKSNFSALNQASKFSVLPKQAMTSNEAYQIPQPSSRQPQINQFNNKKRSFSALGSQAPKKPNTKNSLLNYLGSAGGRGMAQGLLEASGYSDTPVTFGQALSMGMKRGNEATAAESASTLAQAKFNYQKEQDILNRALDYAKIKPASVPALQQNIRAMLKGQGLKPGTPQYDVAFADEIQKYLAKSNGTNVDLDIVNKGKGIDQMDINAANSYAASEKKIIETSELANNQNISIDNMMRLMRNLDESDFGALGGAKLKFQQLMKSIGVDVDNLESKEVFYSLAGDFVMSQISKTKGAISNKEMAYFEMISPGLSRSKQGNLLQLQLAKEVNKFHGKIAIARSDFDIMAAEEGWDSRKTNAEWTKKSKELYENNTVIGNLEKKMENNIINQALDSDMDLLFDPQDKGDNAQVLSQIKNYYKDDGDVADIKLIGYTDEGFPEYLVDLGNDRYEKRTITTNMENQ
tara:strand:- start:36 stop:1505 length:1470 start_codon:yes stop_codon:yes gene_type:complete